MVMSLRPLGKINDYTVVEAVGRTLASLLMTEMEEPVPVTISSPGEEYGAPVGNDGQELGTSRINLFLYHLKESLCIQNMDWIDTGAGNQIPYPLSLQLYYMLNIFTPDKSSNLDEHRILGDVMRVFHSNQIINPIYFEGTLNPNETPQGAPWEQLQIIHHPLPLDDLAAIWHAINKPYRLSVAYEISVVLIKAPEYKSRRVRRVDVTNVTASVFKGKPVLSRIEPSRGYSGDLLTLYGERFDSDYLKVFFDGSQIQPQTIEPGKITLLTPDNLAPGLYELEITNAEGSAGLTRFEEISPFIYRLDPEKKYTEDPDFPRDNSHNPMLTIRGGNFLTDSPGTVEFLAAQNGGAEIAYPIAMDDMTRNSIRWAIPAAMRKDRTTLAIRQGGIRRSNAILLEIPGPQIYRVDPDPVAALPRELIIMGDFFRSGAGNTELYLHPGNLSDPASVDPSDMIPCSVINTSEIRTTLPGSTGSGVYQLVVRVYHQYYSAPFKLTVAAP
jgi:hypothetical protein